MATLDDNSIDAIVCDPPYELGFMGKAWDNSGIAYDVTVWQQCLRVLKPGGHLVAFGGSRTYHRLAVAIEDSGFEIRDQIQWIYGSGFPKSLDVSKAMDKHGGVRPDFGKFRNAVIDALQRNNQTRAQLEKALGNFMISHYLSTGSQPAIPNYKDYCVIRNFCNLGSEWDDLFAPEAVRPVVTKTGEDMFGEYEVDVTQTSGIANKNESKRHTIGASQSVNITITAPSTDLAKQWQGWGTALKPAHEPAVLARKPLCGTVADNVMTWGVGGLNIDGTRVDGTPWHRNDNGIGDPGMWAGKGQQRYAEQHTAGRWPANVILDEDAAVALDMQSGGNVSRFFYTAKASKAEREAGLYYEEWVKGGMQGRQDGSLQGEPVQRANHHPTVKPLSLMRYLVRLVTPKGGKVLDPFMGSGSTGCASIVEGFDFVGIDITPEYVAIAQKRIDHYAVTSPLEGF
jgi:DNA modification methylase